MTVRLTILNSMAGPDFERALDQHLAWGIDTLDLKDAIFGKGIADLTDAEARRVADLIRARRLTVHCLSTGLFAADVELGEEAFRNRHLGRVARVVEIARVLEPHFIRVIAASAGACPAGADHVGWLLAHAPWLVPLYREAVDQITTAGFHATVENETHNNILSTPAEVAAFFRGLDRSQAVTFTWDVQNMWQAGTFPSVAAYEAMRDLIGYYHVKGGRCEPPGRTLEWRSSLAEASWPVVEITRRVVADGVSPVICLNPPHGRPRPDAAEPNFTETDLAFLRRILDRPHLAD